MNIRCNRGVALSVVEGVVGWTFAVGMVYVLTVIAFSM
jgi:lipoprotein signal peptidase